MDANRIAVIAIHGVGDHQPFEMARAVGDLLENLEDGPQPRYGAAFTEDWVRLNVEPVKVMGHVFPAVGSSAERPEKKPRVWGPMGYLSATEHSVQRAVDSGTNSLDHLFMEGQLSQYKGEGPTDTYEFLRLKGVRKPNAPVGTEQAQTDRSSIPEKEVHIYDMFWSDLSGTGTGALRIFGELYQILFHLGSIGVNNVKAASITLRGTPAGAAWKRFDNSQELAAAALALPIPILNLLMLAFTVAVVAVGALTKLSVTQELISTAVVVFAALTGFWGWLLMRKGQFSVTAFRWPVVVFLLASSAVAVPAERFWMDLDRQVNSTAEWVEALAGLIVLAGAAYAIRKVIAAYQKLRPGADRALLVCVLAVGALAVACALRFPPPPPTFVAMTVLLRLIELNFWALLISWGLFWICSFAAFVTGFWAVKRTPAEEKDRAARTNWTARLTLALPATSFLLLTFAAWAGLLTLALPLLPNRANADCASGSVRETQAQVFCYTPLFPKGVPAQTAHDWAWNSMLQAGAGCAPALLLLVCFAAVISIWGLTPSILGEIFPPRGLGAEVEKKAAALGEWLTEGYRFMRWAGRLLYIAIFFLPVGVLVAFLPPGHPVVPYALVTPFMESIGALVAGASIGILGLGGRLSKLSAGFRPLVRVALDVDNWMREHPRDSNPTARICGRYVSLLRYIAQWKDEDDQGYDALIIFAHSQGTVITADLLRFLEVEARAKGGYGNYDDTLAGLDRMNRYLFTMGCPLRQLYGLRFPYLYDYAPAGISENLLPRPEDLGVRKWLNAYRTGDYVGRYLWRPHPWQPVGTVSFRTWDPPQGLPENVWQKGPRVEFSIGPGAHTHYWDSTAEPIAEAMDVLIAHAEMPASPKTLGHGA